MDQTRREIYRSNNQGGRAESHMVRDVEAKIGDELELLSPSLQDGLAITNTLVDLLPWCVFYAIALPQPNKKEYISQQLEPVTERTELYLYNYSIHLNAYQRWEEVDTQLTP